MSTELASGVALLANGENGGRRGTAKRLCRFCRYIAYLPSNIVAPLDSGKTIAALSAQEATFAQKLKRLGGLPLNFPVDNVTV